MLFLRYVKIEKMPGDIIILHMRFLRYGVRQTDEKTDRRTDEKSDT